MTELLDPDSAAAALRALQPEEALTPLSLPSGEPLRFYRPLADAVTDFITEAQDMKRLFTGIEPFDAETRGIGGGHMLVMVGYAHSGKTQLFVHMLRNNKDKRIALYTEDEPATLVLAKLASVESGVNARQLEEQVSQGDERTITLLRAIADEEFPNLIVFDQNLDARTYGYAWDEAQQVWGHEGDGMAWDYLELLNTGGETVQQKFDWVKAFGKSRNMPNIVLHQTSRTAGADGKKMTISSGSYGGEQHATFMIGVRREKASIASALAEEEDRYRRTQKEELLGKIAELRHDLSIADYTLSANLVKNKRPGGQLVDELQFEIVHGTGALILMEQGALPRQYLAKVHAQQQQEKEVPQWEQPSMTL